MFEVGKEYEFTFLEATEHGLVEVPGRRWVVQKIEGALLQLHSPASPPAPADEFLGQSRGKNMVVNTASPFFHSARLVDEIEGEKEALRALAKKRGLGKGPRATGLTAKKETRAQPCAPVCPLGAPDSLIGKARTAIYRWKVGNPDDCARENHGNHARPQRAFGADHVHLERHVRARRGHRRVP